LIDIPNVNIIIQYIIRPINKHKKTVMNILKNISYAKVLDYGCGEGFFSDCFSQSKYCGYDPDIKKITYAKKKFANYKFLSEIPKINLFDLFFFNNVFHHMNPDEISMFLKDFSPSAQNGTHIIIIELKPVDQHQNYIYKLIIKYFESKIHYSELRSVDFYKQLMQKNKFLIVEEKDIDPFYFLLFKKQVL
jgi:hypothetical protein